MNARAQALKPSGIRKFFDLVSRTEGAISLGVGEPDFITAENVRASAVRSIERGKRSIPQTADSIVCAD